MNLFQVNVWHVKMDFILQMENVAKVKNIMI